MITFFKLILSRAVRKFMWVTLTAKHDSHQRMSRRLSFWLKVQEGSEGTIASHDAECIEARRAAEP